MDNNLQVRLAEVDDMDTIIGLIDSAAAWLRTKDTDQWATPWPSRQARDERVMRGVLSHRTWLAEDDAGHPLATVTFSDQGSRRLWNRSERRTPAVYLCRLVVSREHAGLGIGAALVEWAGLRGSRGWSAEWIRIDVWTSNSALHNFYEKHGFVFHKFARREDYPSAALFQKPTAEIDEVAASKFSERSPASQRGTQAPGAALSAPPARAPRAARR